jgi:hypothetical protein
MCYGVSMFAADPSFVRMCFTRRGMLRLGLGVGGAALLLGGGVGAFLLGDKPAGQGSLVLTDGERATVSALADAYFPPHDAVVPARELDVAGRVDAYFARMLPREQRLARALLRIVESWPRASFQGAFSTLALEERIDVLRAWEESHLEQRQQLASVLRTFVGIGYFDDAKVLSALGHRFGCLPMVGP